VGSPWCLIVVDCLSMSACAKGRDGESFIECGARAQRFDFCDWLTQRGRQKVKGIWICWLWVGGQGRNKVGFVWI